MRVPLRILVGAGLAFVLAGAFLLWQGLRHDEVRSPSRTPALPAFRLHTDEGPLSERDLAGHWTFLFFGYTQCPDACPSTFSTIKEISRALETQGASQPSVVFVSLDPARDTPQLLASYAHAFDPRFIGATGSEADLDPLTRALGIFYLRNDNGKAGCGKAFPHLWTRPTSWPSP